MQKNIFKAFLVITSSGGGGHLQAAIAKEQQLRKRYPEGKIIKKDVLKDWVTGLGKWGTHLWNQAQRTGNVAKLEWILQQQKFADILFWPGIFFGTLYHLFKNDIDHVIDTQPIGMSAILKAVRIYNRVKKKDLRVEKVFVDLPTERATSFFTTIKKLSEKDRKRIRLITIDPLIEGGTLEDFWQRHCLLSVKEVQSQSFTIRQAFQSYQEKKREKDLFSLKFHFQSEAEKRYIQDVLSQSERFAHFSESFFSLEFTSSELLFTILLGSQPAYQATLDYVKALIKVSAKYPQKRVTLIVFCAHFSEEKKTLFSYLTAFLDTLNFFPKNLTLIPISFQKDTEIAPLFFYSDVTLTRSGGQTSMELLAVMQGKILIHSETKEKTCHLPILLKGIPFWEAENARYLIEKKGAKVINPALLEEKVAEEILQEFPAWSLDDTRLTS